MALPMQRITNFHVRAKSAHYNKALYWCIQTNMEQYKSVILPKIDSFKVEEQKYQLMKSLIRYAPDLKGADRDRLMNLLDKIGSCTNLKAVYDAMVEHVNARHGLQKD
jgi:hypothetical protein